MADAYNPYQAPAADLAAVPGATGELYTPAMLQHLKDTKPWVRFLSVMGFIVAGLTVIGVIGVLAVSAAGLGESDMGATEVGTMLGVAAMYGLSAAMTLLLAVHMHRYADAIVDAAAGGGVRAVENALLRQKSFWKTAGIMGVVMLVLMGLAMVLGLVMSVMVAQGTVGE